MTAPKPKKEMLSKEYKAPKTEKGSHIELEGGRLISSPTFTTSAKKQEANAEKREKLGNYFGERVRTVTPPPAVPPVSPDTGSTPRTRALKAPPGSIEYDRPYSHFTPEQQALRKENLRDNGPVVISLTDRQQKQTIKRKKN